MSEHGRRFAAVLVDLGGTLVAYVPRSDQPRVRAEGLRRAEELLRRNGATLPGGVDRDARWSMETREAGDYRVRPLEDRLARTFGLPASDPRLIEAARDFVQPVFESARLYDDALPFLTHVRRLGLRSAIVSNTPWGSPASAWREELARHGLDRAVDRSVFCRDVGWRKPDPRIFEHAAAELGVGVRECLFVGDEPTWDVQGPHAIGMAALLIDRSGPPSVRGDRVTSLKEVSEYLTADIDPTAASGTNDPPDRPHGDGWTISRTGGARRRGSPPNSSPPGTRRGIGG